MQITNPSMLPANSLSIFSFCLVFLYSFISFVSYCGTPCSHVWGDALWFGVLYMQSDLNWCSIFSFFLSFFFSILFLFCFLSSFLFLHHCMFFTISTILFYILGLLYVYGLLICKSMLGIRKPSWWMAWNIVRKRCSLLKHHGLLYDISLMYYF